MANSLRPEPMGVYLSVFSTPAVWTVPVSAEQRPAGLGKRTGTNATARLSADAVTAARTVSRPGSGTVRQGGQAGCKYRETDLASRHKASPAHRVCSILFKKKRYPMYLNSWCKESHFVSSQSAEVKSCHIAQLVMEQHSTCKSPKMHIL